MRLGVHLLLFSAMLAGPAALCAADKAEAPNPTKLVDRLGSLEFAERQEATRALDDLGAQALSALKAGLSSDDMEVRRRCEELLEKIERRIESARTVVAKQIQLSYKDTPLSEAVADFTRKSGYAIELGDAARSGARRITLETGTVSFWEALDRFCVAAGLVESGLLPTNNTAKPGSPEELQRQMAEQQLLLARGGRGYNPYGQVQVDPGKIVLMEGKMPTLPTFQSTALRVRLLPNTVAVTAPPVANGEKTIPLEVTPEPGLSWLGMVSVRIDRAVDDQGQPLTQPALFLSQGNDFALNPYAQNVVWNVNGAVYYGGYPQTAPTNPNHAPIRLKMGEMPAKMIKQLEGTVTCQVQSPVEALITVDNVLKAAGTSTDGVDGGSIKVVEVNREKNGQVRLKVVVQPPSQEIFDPSLGAGLGVRQIQIRRAVMQMKMGGAMGPTNVASPGTLELRDEKGVPFQLTANQVQQQQAQVFGGGFGVMEQELVFQPNAGQGAPAKLVFVGRRTVTAEVPFSLKDVPLP